MPITLKEWKARRVAAGLCIECGKPRYHAAVRCNDCAARARIRMRIRKGCQPWQPGKRGRPPKGAK
jgi:hypothetical protein